MCTGSRFWQEPVHVISFRVLLLERKNQSLKGYRGQCQLAVWCICNWFLVQFAHGGGFWVFQYHLSTPLLNLLACCYGVVGHPPATTWED